MLRQLHVHVLRALIALLFVAFTGCDRRAELEKYAGPEDEAFAKAQIQALKAGDFAGLEKLFDASLKRPNLRETLAKMASLIPAQEPLSVTLVGAYRVTAPDAVATNITYEYEYPDRWLLINIATAKKASAVAIIGFAVQPEPQSLDELNRFTLSDKSAYHYIVLVLVVAVPLTCLCALVLCIRTKMKGRKWTWVIFILLGFGKVALNWTNGQFAIVLLHVMLFGAGATAPPHGPWTLSVSLPLGAILFLIRRNKLRVPEDAGGAAAVAAPPAATN